MHLSRLSQAKAVGRQCHNLDLPTVSNRHEQPAIALKARTTIVLRKLLYLANPIPRFQR